MLVRSSPSKKWPQRGHSATSLIFFYDLATASIASTIVEVGLALQ
jgi:hypothetical protein